MSNEIHDRFNDIVTRIAAGEDVNNDDAKLLAQVIRNLDQNLTIADQVLTAASDIVPDALNRFGVEVLRRAGRTDAKIRKSVQKMAAQHAALFWAQLQKTVIALDNEEDASTVADTEEGTAE